MSSTPSYEEVRASHRWDVPARYNIAADVCDKHPRDKPAMIWESFDGTTRELDWGELQDLANQAAHVLRDCAISKGDRVAVVLPPTPETAAIFFGVWKLGAILISLSVLYGDDAIEHRLSDSGAALVVTDADNASRFDHQWAPAVLVLQDDTLTHEPTDPICEDTSADDPAQLYYTSGTTGLAKGVVHAHRYILAHEEFIYSPRGAGRRALPRYGRVGVGGGHRAAARALAARRRAMRLPARGGLRSREAARLPQPARGHERLHDADGDALDDGDRGRRNAVSAERSAACARRASR